MDDKCKIIKTPNIAEALDRLLIGMKFNRLFVLTDSTVADIMLPKIQKIVDGFNAEIITIPAGEEHKTLETLAGVWQYLSDNGGTRKSVLINLGGGVVTDLGGFAASTFKRGIRFINVPTTVLGAVDAAVGGKTGIDFNGLKNEIGAFATAEAVVISPEPLSSLPYSQIISGMGEVIKTAMISSAEFYDSLIAEDMTNDDRSLAEAMDKCVKFKAWVTDEDPREAGLRKILNFGHTAGHTLETMMLRRGTPVSHGEAVANGILISLVLSHMKHGLPSAEIYKYANSLLKRYFSTIPLSCKDYPKITEIMGHDKKNDVEGEFRFVLLKEIGKPEFDVRVSLDELHSALDIYCDLCGF